MLLPLSWIKEYGQKFIIYCLLKNPMFIIYSRLKLLKTEGLTSSFFVGLKILKALNGALMNLKFSHEEILK
jgi:hypothetical protein